MKVMPRKATVAPGVSGPPKSASADRGQSSSISRARAIAALAARIMAEPYRPPAGGQ